MGRRTLLLVVSVLVAAVGVGLIALYVRGADRRAGERAERIYGSLPETTPTPKATLPAHHDDIADYGLTIEVTDPDRAIGLLQPGDWVAVYNTHKADPTKSRPSETVSTQIIRKIKVIGVGPKHDVKSADGETIPLTIVALDADDDQITTILEAQAGGSLTIVPLGRHPSAKTPRKAAKRSPGPTPNPSRPVPTGSPRPTPTGSPTPTPTRA
jgi:hypothetical protein